MIVIHPESLLRFQADLDRLTGGAGRVGIAVSGGPDSLALLLLAHSAIPDRIAAATVDHGLREEAAGEARFVAAMCATLGIPHATLRPEVPITGNIQSAARKARYALLENWADQHNLDWIATAHHADDQAETLLMRLSRGAGVAGLSGVRAVNGRVIRPLLGWRRAELVALVENAGIVAVDDPSNRDDRFDRVKLRKHLANAPWIDVPALAQSAAHLADAETALEWATKQEAQRRIISTEGHVVFDPAGLPDELLFRLCQTVMSIVEPGQAGRGGQLADLINSLKSGQKATLGSVVATPGERWRFEKAPPRRKI
jgi:tRNA(Ile)-lysidine synthase